MKANVALTLCASAVAAIPFSIKPRQTTTSCATGAHIISSRGSTEPQGDGEIGSLSTLIQQQIPGSDDYATVYPALLSPYQESEGNGTNAVLTEIQQYVTSCPHTKIVLLGWSQGGQITLDALCGTSESGFNATAPLAGQYGKNIAAVVVYGDPSRVPGQPYDVGNATTQTGLFPRMDTAGCNSYSSITQSYCDIGDPFCAGGGNLSVHLGYFDKYNTQAAKFVVDTLQRTT